MPKQDQKRIQAEAELVADFYKKLNGKGREFVMLALSQANQPEYMLPPRAVKKETPPAFAAVACIQTAPERLTVANEDNANLRNGKWNLNSKRMRNMIASGRLVMSSPSVLEHYLPKNYFPAA